MDLTYAQNSPFTLRLFGKLEVESKGILLPYQNSRQEHLLLALLALKGEMDRSVVAAHLWPPEMCASDHALKNLRQCLYFLRQSLGEEAFRLIHPEGNATRLGLDLSGAYVDVHDFDRRIASNTLEALQQAIALYQGPLLMNYNELKITEERPGWLWILEERRKRQIAFRDTVTQLSVQAQVLGHHDMTIDYLQRAVEADRLWQHGYFLLMEALARSGKEKQAIGVYERCCRLLEREEGDSPEAEIVRLAERLRQKIRQRLKQPPAEAKPSLISPPNTVQQGYLPNPPTRFVERQQDMIQVIACLKSDRLVTLTGSGGVGKTRLAIRVSEEIRSDYQDGVWFVDLSLLPAGSEARRVAGAAASTLKLREKPGQDSLTCLVDYLASRRLLLLLDNCEQVLAGSVAVIRAVLSACQGVRILATSRQALGLPFEVRWLVPPLPVPNTAPLPHTPDALPDYLRSYSAVTLFVERATAAHRAFALNVENARDVADICCQLDGVPLALELAAARVSGMTVTELARRLDGLYETPLPASPTPADRQHSLRALIDWSYDLLSEPERKVLARLAVFRGGWTLDAAAAICSDAGHYRSPGFFSSTAYVSHSRRGRGNAEAGAPERASAVSENTPVEDWQVGRWLAALVDKSMVLFEEQGQNARYRLLETVREYCWERLQTSGEQEAIQERHRDFFLAFAEEAETKLRSAEQLSWFRRVQADQDNLRAAMESSLAENGNAEIACRLTGALWYFWKVRGFYLEGRERLEAILNRMSSTRTTAHLKVLLATAQFLDHQSETEKALALMREGLELAHATGDLELIGRSLHLLGWLCRNIDPAMAADLMEQAVAKGRECGNQWMIADALSSWGFHELFQGRYERGEVLLREGLQAARLAGDRYLIGELVYHIGLVACTRGEYTVATGLLQESLIFHKTIGDLSGVANRMTHLANCHLAQGQSDEAETLYRQGLQLACNQGLKRSLIASLEGLACLEVQRNHLEHAACLFGAADAIQGTTQKPLLPIWAAQHDRFHDKVKEGLTTQEYTLAWTKGQMMTQEQAVHFAMEDLPVPSELDNEVNTPS